MLHNKGIRSVIAGTGVVTVGLIAFASSAFAATPTLKATPNTGLKNGQSVAVTGKGYPDSSTVYLVECQKSATSEAGCDLSTATAVTTTSKGALSGKFKVVTGTVGSGKCGTSKKNAKNCVLVAGSISGTEYAKAAIAFKG